MAIRMGILIKKGTTKRDWLKLAGATAETALKSLVLGKDGFSAAIPPLFSVFEALRGNDSLERRATRLVLETLSYAIAKTVSSIELESPPREPELQSIVERLLTRVQILAQQSDVVIDKSDVEHPGTFPLFSDIAGRLFHELHLNEPKTREADVIAVFQTAVTEGLSRVRTRNPDYYSSVFEALSGLDASGDLRVRAWQKYRELLVRRFEDEPLFGEDEKTGVTLGQVYQRLRAYWEDEKEEEGSGTSRPTVRKTRHLGMLDDLVLEWLEKDNKSDRLRLVSGGPGSGKSTFARRLASLLAIRAQWRVLFVPLQRLKGAGPLEHRIDEYFRSQGDEPFGPDSSPLVSIGQDGHRDWLIIFDGLDELAKEGTSSESAAQDFASALADWRARIGNASVRFLVLGRAPSMQEARRRLGLRGEGTVHVAGMAPFPKSHRNQKDISYVDTLKLQVADQRPEFWRRWAIVKGLSLDVPEAMKVDELLDLTNEPLLAYLLILSGYVSDRWREAAENRNRIYKAIFDQIWERERTKPTRLHLNDLGREGFEFLLQALGLAAWRGGGRTGDDATFMSVRDIFMRRDLLDKARACGAADLSNVALLFYTRKDEEGGGGYEFLHKSFGEYLTARGLFSAYVRWGQQVREPTLDFDSAEFLRRWIKLAGPAPITREIISFLRNEVRLFSSGQDSVKPWAAARAIIDTAERLVDLAAREGFPAPEGRFLWREAEAQQRNAEETLISLLDALARTAYPAELLNVKANEGKWEPGPIAIPEFAKGDQFARLLARLAQPTHGWMVSGHYSGPMNGSLVFSMLSRISIRGVTLIGMAFSGADFFGADLTNVQFIGCFFVNSSFLGAKLGSLELSVFGNCDFTGVDFKRVRLIHSYLDAESSNSAKLSQTQRKSISRRTLAPFSAYTR